jgi:hypothetical protein
MEFENGFEILLCVKLNSVQLNYGNKVEEFRFKYKNWQLV